MTIQWYPGHMAKARRLVEENLKLVDLVFELLDARIPVSSRNPDIDRIVRRKPRLILLNKADLADQAETVAWIDFFRKNGLTALPISAVSGQGMNQITKEAKELAKDRLAALALKGRMLKTIRVMVLGIPNVGKSSLINRLAGKGAAKTGDLPGVTRGKQWIRLKGDLELLDTPGILWPKFADPEVGFKLAATGAISPLVFDNIEVALKLISFLQDTKPEGLQNQYKITELAHTPLDNLIEIGRRRGFLQKGNEVDLEKSAGLLLADFRDGKIGRITLDIVPEKKAELCRDEDVNILE